MGLTRQTVINVVPELSDVLVIDGEARWEYHYLTVALKRDPTGQGSEVAWSSTSLVSRKSQKKN